MSFTVRNAETLVEVFLLRVAEQIHVYKFGRDLESQEPANDRFTPRQAVIDIWTCFIPGYRAQFECQGVGTTERYFLIEFLSTSASLGVANHAVKARSRASLANPPENLFHPPPVVSPAQRAALRERLTCNERQDEQRWVVLPLPARHAQSTRGSGARTKVLFRGVQEKLTRWLPVGKVAVVLNPAPESGGQQFPGRAVAGEGIWEVERNPQRLVWWIENDTWARYVVLVRTTTTLSASVRTHFIRLARVLHIDTSRR